MMKFGGYLIGFAQINDEIRKKNKFSKLLKLYYKPIGQ